MSVERLVPNRVPSSMLPLMQALQVSAKNVEDVCGQASLEESQHPSVNQLGRPSVTPPLPVLPTWVTPQSLRYLERGGEDTSLAEEAAASSVAVVVDEQQLYADMSLHVDVPQCPDSPDNLVQVSPSDMDVNGQLRHQLEYYFSRENLLGDTYLRSQMDNDQFVPIKVIANFPKVKRLTDKLDVIVNILRESPYVQVDEHGEKVRPAIQRSTLILRDIADNTHKTEVLELFQSNKACPPVVSVDYASNNSWYVNFDSDADAQKAFCFLRVQRKTFKGKPILARIKTGPVPRASPTDGLRPAIPNSLPGLMAPTLGTPPPRSDPGNSPPQDPVVFSSPTPNDPPVYYTVPTTVVSPNGYAFDLGQILNMNGYELHATYKPPIISVPPATMQQIAASHALHSPAALSPQSHSTWRMSKTSLAVPDKSDRSSNSSHDSSRNHSRISDGYGGRPLSYGGPRGVRGGGRSYRGGYYNEHGGHRPPAMYGYMNGHTRHYDRPRYNGPKCDPHSPNDRNSGGNQRRGGYNRRGTEGHPSERGRGASTPVATSEPATLGVSVVKCEAEFDLAKSAFPPLPTTCEEEKGSNVSAVLEPQPPASFSSVLCGARKKSIGTVSASASASVVQVVDDKMSYAQKVQKVSPSTSSCADEVKQVSVNVR